MRRISVGLGAFMLHDPHGYFGVDLEVKSKTAEAATELMLMEFDRVHSERQSYVWPPRFDD